MKVSLLLLLIVLLILTGCTFSHEGGNTEIELKGFITKSQWLESGYEIHTENGQTHILYLENNSLETFLDSHVLITGHFTNIRFSVDKNIAEYFHTLVIEEIYQINRSSFFGCFGGDCIEKSCMKNTDCEAVKRTTTCCFSWHAINKNFTADFESKFPSQNNTIIYCETCLTSQDAPLVACVDSFCSIIR